MNWPLKGEGIYSPVGSPYVSPGLRHNDPSVSELEYAVYMLRYLVMAICSGMVERVYWWRLVARGFGLVDDRDPDAWRERPAFAMLRQFLATLGEARFLRRMSGPQDAELYLFETAGGERICFAYTTSTTCRLELPCQYSRVVDAFGYPLAQSGNGAALDLCGTPVYIHGVDGE